MLPNQFQRLARLIIKQYPEAPQIHEAENHPVYLLTFGVDVDIHLVGSQPGYINLVATFPAPKPWLAPEGLRALLAENIFSLQHPVLSAGLEATSGKMVLSLRQSLAELSDESAVYLFDSFVQRAIDFHSGKILPPTQSRVHTKPEGLSAANLSALKNQSLRV